MTDEREAPQGGIVVEAAVARRARRRRQQSDLLVEAYGRDLDAGAAASLPMGRREGGAGDEGISLE